jgi:Ca2+-binding RTX toxin-like protein
MPNFEFGDDSDETFNEKDGISGDVDWVYASGGNDWAYGLGGNDFLFGEDGDDHLFGGLGNDYLMGGAGLDELDGGDGDEDAASYAYSWQGVAVTLTDGGMGWGFGGDAEGDTLVGIEGLHGSQYNDYLSGNGDENFLLGFAGEDTLKGGGGADHLQGNDGNDVLKGGGGADELWGGNHGQNGPNESDTAAYNSSPAGVFVSLIAGLAAFGDADGDTFHSIENLTGSAHTDTLAGDDYNNILSGIDGADHLFGYDGHDTLDGGIGVDDMHGGLGNDTYYVDLMEDAVEELVGQGMDVVRTNVSWVLPSGAEVEGLEAADPTATTGIYLIGNAINNRIVGNAGSNMINGEAGADDMVGRGGSDTYYVDNFFDSVTESGGEGTDVVRTSVSWVMTWGADIETLETTDPNGTENLFLRGNANGNHIIGNNGDNSINGDGGRDQMFGRGGSDTYYVDDAGDTVGESAGQGSDEVLTSVSWTLTAGADVETLRTTDDYSVGAIDLTGNESGNIVRGNDGSNTINGGAGNDSLTGRGGWDLFWFDTALDDNPMPDGYTNIDAITDFNVADDTIVLDRSIFGALGLGSLAPGAFRIGTIALDADDRIIYNNVTGALSYDSDGLGGTAAIQFATLNMAPALTYLDFLVVA